MWTSVYQWFAETLTTLILVHLNAGFTDIQPCFYTSTHELKVEAREVFLNVPPTLA